MGISSGRRRTLAALITTVVIAVFVFALPSAASAAPTAPILREATLSGGGTGLHLWWTASTDTAGGTLQYQVYRDDVPMTIATYATAGELVTTTSATDVTVTPKADEATKKFTYFYTVVVTNTTTNQKAISTNISPNVHGGLRSPLPTYNCQLCHSVHGGAPQGYLGAATRYRCYRCHGNTDASTNYGAAAVRNVQRDFYDYATGQTIPETVSRHYNEVNKTTETECTMCHTPHKSPYYVDGAGVYQPSQSFTQLLRVQLSFVKPYSYFYSVDNAAAGNSFCLQCHGANTATLDGNAGAGAYVRTGGNHEASYATGAHSATVVLTNTASTNPGIQCEACHNKHAASAGSLADWRSQGQTDGTVNNQAGLCFQCHKTASAESTYLGGSRIAGSSAPYSWRGVSLVADVYDQFKNPARKSTHPLSAGSGRWVPTSGTVFAQSKQAEFDTDTLSQTVTNTADGDGSVVLGTQDVSTPIPPERFMFYQRSASLVVDAYEYDSGATGTWNTPYNPTDDTGQFNTATGSNLFAAGGNIYRTRGGGSTTTPMIRQFTLGADSNGAWGNTALTTAFNTAFGAGAAVAVNEPGSVAYLSAGGNSNVINWWDFPANSENSMTFSGGTLGAGSSIAYTPDADRLWVVLRNGTAGAGTLWYLSAPGVKTGAQTFTNTNVVAGPSGTTNTYYSRMTYFEDANGTDYLANMGRDGTARFFHVLSNLGSAAPTRLRLTAATKEPSGGGALADGCSLQWDGVPGGYIYATLGGTSTAIKRIRIPEDPTVDGGTTGWGTWETLTNALPAAAGAGADITFAMVDRPGSTILPNYYGTGTVATGEISAVAGATAWGALTWNGSTPANTTLSVTVRYSTDNWATSTDRAGIPSGADLNVLGIPVTAKVRLVANLATSAPITSTPQLDDWAVTSVSPIFVPSGSLTCYSCHNTHAVKKGAATAWDLSRVSDPDNIQDTFSVAYPTGTVADFCLKCHDASPPQDSGNTATKFVPYSVGFRPFDAAASPFFFGRELWNKEATGAAWTGSAHDTATTAIAKDCGTCHDPHSSNWDNLVAYTGGTSVRANTDASVSKEENLCYAGSGCHNSASGTRNVQTPMSQTYNHQTVAVSDVHSAEENGSNLQTGTAQRHAECADCHDPHAARAGVHTRGSSKAGNALLGASGLVPVYGTPFSGSAGQDWTTMNTPTSYVPERMNGEADDNEAYVCIKCHSGYAGESSYKDLALAFNPGNQSEHNVFGQAVGMEGSFVVNGVTYDMPLPADSAFLKTADGWTHDSAVTCTDCHSNTTAGQARGPHGSSTPWMMATGYVTWTTSTTLQNLNTAVGGQYIICTKCHQNLLNSNAAHADHDNRATCMNCHIRVPHGWKRPRLLVSSNDPAYLSSNGRIGQGVSLRNRTGPNDWNDGSTDCGGGCDNRHNLASNFWP